MKKPAILGILAAAVAFGLGALSANTRANIRAELIRRAGLAEIQRDQFADLSPSAAAVFQGRADAAFAIAAGDIDTPHRAAYLRGFAEATLLAAILIEIETAAENDK